MSIDNATTMARNRNFRMAAVEATPEWAFPRVYNRVTGPQTHLSRSEGGDAMWLLKLPGRSVKLVRPQDAVRITHIGSEPERRVYDRYTLDEGFEPQDCDVVVDVGAYLGEFSWGVANYTSPEKVIAVEPDPRSAVCLEYNTPDVVEVQQCAAGSSNKRTSIHLASDPSESGFLQPDKGRSSKSETMFKRLDSVTDHVDYLKVEAEGFEPEVLQGMGPLRPPKVVVNVSPERYGQSTAPKCTEILHERGYSTRRDGHELFAWLE